MISHFETPPTCLFPLAKSDDPQEAAEKARFLRVAPLQCVKNSKRCHSVHGEPECAAYRGISLSPCVQKQRDPSLRSGCQQENFFRNLLQPKQPRRIPPENMVAVLC